MTTNPQKTPELTRADMRAWIERKRDATAIPEMREHLERVLASFDEVDRKDVRR